MIGDRVQPLGRSQSSMQTSSSLSSSPATTFSSFSRLEVEERWSVESPEGGAESEPIGSRKRRRWSVIESVCILEEMESFSRPDTVGTREGGEVSVRRVSDTLKRLMPTAFCNRATCGAKEGFQSTSVQFSLHTAKDSSIFKQTNILQEWIFFHHNSRHEIGFRGA